MYGYILITHGPRHGIKDLFAHAGAGRQARNLRQFHENRIKLEVPGDHLRIFHDYCRKPQSLGDLPKLMHGLHCYAEAGEQAAFFVDDLTGIFCRFPRSKRVDILAQLLPFGSHLYGIAQECRLASIPKGELEKLVDAERQAFVFPNASVARTADGRKQQTSKAIGMSAKVRANLSDRKARDLKELWEALVADDPDLTYEALAAEANRRGLKTTRGRAWTRSTARRMLLRADPDPAKR